MDWQKYAVGELMVVGYRCGAWWDHRDDLHYIGVESGKGCTLVIGTVSSIISSNQSSFPTLERSSGKCQIITGTKPLVLSFLVSMHCYPHGRPRGYPNYHRYPLYH